MAERIARLPTAFQGGAKTPKVRSEAHRRFIASLPCLVCPRGGETQCAHVRMGSIDHGKLETGAGTKPSDAWSVPLCLYHHAQQHSMGERLFWEITGIDVLTIAALLWLHTGDEIAALSVCRNARHAFPARG